MLHLGFSAGLRVSELVGLRMSQVVFQPRPVVEVLGKGRRERVLPLWKATASMIPEPPTTGTFQQRGGGGSAPIVDAGPGLHACRGEMLDLDAAILDACGPSGWEVR